MSIFCLLNLVQLQLIPASVGFFFPKSSGRNNAKHACKYTFKNDYSSREKYITSGNGVGEASERSQSQFKFTYKYGSVRRDREPSRLQCRKIIKMSHKNSCRKCNLYNIPHSSQMKNFLAYDFRSCK